MITLKRKIKTYKIYAALISYQSLNVLGRVCVCVSVWCATGIEP